LPGEATGTPDTIPSPKSESINPSTLGRPQVTRPVRSILIPALVLAGACGAIWFDQHEAYQRIRESLAWRLGTVEARQRETAAAEPRLRQFRAESVRLASELGRFSAAIPPRLSTQRFLELFGQIADSNDVRLQPIGVPQTTSRNGARWARIDLRLLGSPVALPPHLTHPLPGGRARASAPSAPGLQHQADRARSELARHMIVNTFCPGSQHETSGCPPHARATDHTPGRSPLAGRTAGCAPSSPRRAEGIDSPANEVNPMTRSANRTPRASR
jgi:hypothetical protein